MFGKREKVGFPDKDGMARLFAFCGILAFLVIFAGCSELQKPKTEPYYSETAPPPKQEFRWSNGKMPKSFDPALAKAPPETDIARAIFEGLTETNSANLETRPAIALTWKADEENRNWTFELRRDAKWSNGETVTANDFVRSWKRLTEIGNKVSHADLLSNIVGLEIKKENDQTTDSSGISESAEVSPGKASESKPESRTAPSVEAAKISIKNPANVVEKPKNENALAVETKVSAKKSPVSEEKHIAENVEFGVEAVGDFKLKVALIRPDKDFPALVAHPLFRPVHKDAKFEEGKLNADIVTNGAFRIVSVGQDGVTLDRSENYWNRSKVKLERVRFIPKENAEAALEAYRAGELDAVTNANFEPLALKLLMPYDDFKRTVHSALNFYEFNQKNKPFDDKRVREALAISIERERLTEDEMDGSTKPALGFQPYDEANQAKLEQDVEKAKTLFEEAGFANGEKFPTVRLVINRNNVQQRIARSVAKMWKENLNIETEIVVKESEEIDSAVSEGDYDMIRRGVVFPTADETPKMLAIFSGKKPGDSETVDQILPDSYKPNKPLKPNSHGSPENEGLVKPSSDANAKSESEILAELEVDKLILTEDQAIKELRAIPLYFPTSFSLVKPYVLGFEINTLDASSLIDVSIDNNWQPKTQRGES